MIYGNFEAAIRGIRNDILVASTEVHTERWQGITIKQKPEMGMRELLNVFFQVPMARTGIGLEGYQRQIRPNLPWADNHFEERVCGFPINPGTEWANWPYGKSADTFREPCLGPRIPPCDWSYLAGMVDGEGTIYFRDKERWQGVIRVYQKDRMICDHLFNLFKVGKVASNNVETKTNIHGKEVDNHCFFWQINAVKEVQWLLTELIPYLVIKKEKAIEALTHINQALSTPTFSGSKQKKVWGKDWEPRFNHNYMMRYWPKGENGSQYRGMIHPYGDLNDVVKLLAREPDTRQAFFPVWFPEDTGVIHGGRVPCSLGYQFLMRNGFLHITYYLRSCDYTRHFRDDIYLTVRLLLWMLKRLRDLRPEVWDGVVPGFYSMHIMNLHAFKNDFEGMKQELADEN